MESFFPKIKQGIRDSSQANDSTWRNHVLLDPKYGEGGLCVRKRKGRPRFRTGAETTIDRNDNRKNENSPPSAGTTRGRVPEKIFLNARMAQSARRLETERRQKGEGCVGEEVGGSPHASGQKDLLGQARKVDRGTGGRKFDSFHCINNCNNFCSS